MELSWSPIDLLTVEVSEGAPERGVVQKQL